MCQMGWHVCDSLQRAPAKRLVSTVPLVEEIAVGYLDKRGLLGCSWNEKPQKGWQICWWQRKYHRLPSMPLPGDRWACNQMSRGWVVPRPWGRHFSCCVCMTPLLHTGSADNVFMPEPRFYLLGPSFPLSHAQSFSFSQSIIVLFLEQEKFFVLWVFYYPIVSSP